MQIPALKEQLQRAGVRPSKALGQHFLLQEEVAERMVARAAVAPGETILEVGPGLGMLTAPLLQAGAHVVAVERDPRLCAFLRNRFPTLSVVEGDVLRAKLPPFDRVVSNLPYEISTPFTMALLDREFQRAVLTYQREFAERLLAVPGTKAYSRVTVKAYYHCTTELVEVLPPRAFWPAPDVESAILQLDPRPPPFAVDRVAYEAVAAALFRHRRKMARNALRLEWRTLTDSPDRLDAEVQATPYAQRRADGMSPAELADLTNNLTLKVKRRPPHGSGPRRRDGPKEDAE